MRLRFFASVLAVSFIFIASAGMLCAYTELRTAMAISGEGVIPLTPGPLLDDFRNASPTESPINLWNTITGTFSRSAAATPPADERCGASYPIDADPARGKCLQLDYDVSRPFDSTRTEDSVNYSTFAGYYSTLGGASLSSPLPGAALKPTSVSFYVKGAVGGEFFKIQLKNNSTAEYTFIDITGTYHYNRNESSVYITDLLDGGVTTSWQKVTIPLHNFANLDGFNSMKEFVIVFENAQSITNGSLPSGKIYIDNITFETTPISAVRIDHFGDNLGVCALGGNIGTGVGDGAIELFNKSSFSGVPNEFSPRANSLKLEYNVSTTDINRGYAYTFIIFGGANNAKGIFIQAKDKSGWIALPHDFSAYTMLTFRVRAKDPLHNPKQIKVELADNVGTKAAAVANISSTNWNVYVIPLYDFLLLDKSSIKQLTFVFEAARITSVSGSRSGEIYIDSIQFE